jgi:hypothetical protein
MGGVVSNGADAATVGLGNDERLWASLAHSVRIRRKEALDAAVVKKVQSLTVYGATE